MSSQNHPGPYPIGTLVYYGPDNQTVTKIAASVVLAENTQPIMRRWVGEDIATNPDVIHELGKFFQEHQVQKVVMTDHIAGCPHEAGVDYPAGQDCPLCPYWRSQ